MEEAQERFTAHQTRRLAGVPTVSVVVGQVGRGLHAVREWVRDNERTLLVVDGRDTGDVFDTIVEAVLNDSRLQSRVVEFVADITHHSVAEVERLLCVGREGDEFGDQLTQQNAHVAEAWRAVRRGTRRFDGGWRDEHAVARLGVLLDVAGPLAPAVVAPGVRLSLEGLRDLVVLSETQPALIAHVVYSDNEWNATDEQLRGTRLLGQLREGLVRLGSPLHDERQVTSTPEGTSAPEPLHTTLKSRGVVELPVAAAEQAAQVLREPGDLAAHEQARSAVEDFLFGVLEQCPMTVGLFELNGKLDVKHGHQRAEVDLLCRSLRIAVELDGYYHFTSRDRYRSDRRKDVLLQENGYLVIRFLAEDAVPDLEHVLHTIEHALQWRRAQEEKPR